MSERKIKLQEIVNAAVAAGLRDLPTMLPAKVVKWDATKQKADCQILIKQVTTGEDESREVNPFGVVPAVPVQFLGAGGFRITCPISDGSSSAATTGSLFFSMRSLDKWLTGTGAEVDPEFDHAHALTDAVFVPGLMPFGAPWQSCPTDKLSIGRDASPSDIEIDNTGNVNVANGANGAARTNDAVNAGSLTGVANTVTGVVTFIYTDANGTPASGSTTAVLTGGKVTGGSTKVKIG